MSKCIKSIFFNYTPPQNQQYSNTKSNTAKSNLDLQITKLKWKERLKHLRKKINNAVEEKKIRRKKPELIFKNKKNNKMIIRNGTQYSVCPCMEQF